MQLTQQVEVLRAGELEVRPSEHLAARAGGRCRCRCASSSCSRRWRGERAGSCRGRSCTRRSGARRCAAGPLGGRLRPQAADQAGRGAARSGGSSTPTSGSATASSPSLHSLFTGREQVGNRSARGLRGSRLQIEKEGSMTTRFMPALAARGRAGPRRRRVRRRLQRERHRRGSSERDAPRRRRRACPATSPARARARRKPRRQAWIAGFQDANPDATIAYDPVGSGGGREQFIAGGTRSAAPTRTSRTRS